MPIETAVEHDIHAQLQSGDADRLIARIAERQHGVIARRQLIEAGLGRGAIVHRLSLERLQIVHRSVYAVGHRVLTAEGRCMAAVLAAGRGAAASHRCAAALWRLLASEVFEVTLPYSRRPPPGIVVHHSHLPCDEVTEVRGIPVTTVPRTLLDLAAVLPPHRVERAINEAEFRRRSDPLSLADLIERYPRRRGNRTIKAILEKLQIGGTVMRSELESRFFAFVRRAGLPPPEVNSSLLIGDRRIECDFVWRTQLLIVELDGRAAHATTAAFDRNRARDRMLSAHGWRVVRVTWRQLHDEPQAIAADLRKMLA